MTTVTSAWTEVDGLLIHSRVSVGSPPAAPVVVLVHGFIISSRYMAPLAERLSPSFNVYAPDLPGFGWSESPRRLLGLDELANSLVAWMAAVDLPSVSLLGNSFGCQVITELATRYPERVGRVVLVGPTIDPAHRTALQQVARLQLDMIREPWSLLPLHIPDYVRAGPRRVWRTYRAMMDDRIEAKLPLITAPTLVVRGGRDPVVPRRWAEEAARLLPCGRLEEIPDRAHALNFNAPGALAEVVQPFLESPSDRSVPIDIRSRRRSP